MGPVVFLSLAAHRRPAAWKCLWKSSSPPLIFWNFRKTRGCMMVFQQNSQESRCRRAQGLVSNRWVLGCCPCLQASGRKMRRNRHRFLSLGISIFAVLTLSPALVGQASPDSEAAFGLPTDWSHHHVIFSKPGSAEQARRVQRDPRYWQQLSRRSSALVVTEKNDPASGLQPDSNASRPAKNGHLNGDWSQDIGSGATVGATDFPAKYSFNLKQANCGSAPQPDFAVYTTGIFGSSQASIVAYDNLYSGCGGTVPTVYWAYSTGAKTLTSPVFSRDGTQIAFVQSNSLSHGVLVLLKWAASTTETVTSPATPTHVSPAAYLTCTAPCLTTAGLPGLPGVFNNDTNSSVFYDYSNDTAYVGDDAGWLHKFTPVFNGILTDV